MVSDWAFNPLFEWVSDTDASHIQLFTNYHNCYKHNSERERGSSDSSDPDSSLIAKKDLREEESFYKCPTRTTKYPDKTQLSTCNIIKVGAFFRTHTQLELHVLS